MNTELSEPGVGADIATWFDLVGVQEGMQAITTLFGEALAAFAVDRERRVIAWTPAAERPSRLRAVQHAPVHGLLSQVPAVQMVFHTIRNVAETDTTVLVRGESGTGKELVARAIHHESHRRDAPFSAVNCAALTPSLLESELFGHVKGAFTGAATHRVGIFEQAA